MIQNTQVGRSKAWRRGQSRRIRTKVAEATKWLSATLQKRKADRPAPVAGAKPHAHGKLTLIQRQRQAWRLDAEMREEFNGVAA